MKSFTIKLQHAQGEWFRKAWDESAKCGDCEIVGRYEPRVTFRDYEGVQGTLRRLAQIATPTGARVRSLRAIRRKIGEGIGGGENK